MRFWPVVLSFWFGWAIAGPGQAQHWATRAVCDVSDIAVFDDAFAPATRTEIENAAARIPNGVGRFWRITAPNGAVSYLWGTMHSSDPRILDLPQEVEDAIEAARVVVLEIDPIAPTRRIYERDLARSDWFRPARSNVDLVEDGLPSEILEWIRQRTHGIGWGRKAPERLTFGALAELLLSDPCDDFSAGIIPIQDSRIQTLALVEGAGILALEETGRIKARLDRPDQDEFAIDFLSVYGSYLNPEIRWQDRATVFALYLSGRIGAMMAWDRSYVSLILQDNGRAVDRVNAYLLDERNRGFVAAAEEALQSGDVLVAVGAFHLPGEAGMVALLRNAGFEVTRIRLPGET